MLVKEIKPKNVKMREEEGDRGAQEKRERGNASNEVSALLRAKGEKDGRYKASKQIGRQVDDLVEWLY